MSQPTAKSVLSSVHALDPSKRLDTLLLRMPRCILSEFNTHRMFSRNAASSRAIPVEKMLAQIENDPFIPLWWGLNEKGMQAFGQHSDPATCEKEWLLARDKAVTSARQLVDLGLHKQVINRLVEPWMWTTVICTSSNWSNFLALRDHPDAEPHIQILAREVRKALDGAEVHTLQPGEWHMPWITDADHVEVLNMHNGPALKLKLLQKLSVACCASTSYKTVEGFDMTMERAEAIYDKLYTMKPIHASPFEHVARADETWIDGTWKMPELSGNFEPGWIQLRKTLEGECL